MNYYHLHGGSVEDGYCSPHGPPSSQPYQRRFPSLEHDLVELSWQNGGIVMNSQAQRRAAASCSEAKNLQKPEVHPKHRDPFEGSIREEDERETATWLHYPIDDPLDGDFCPEFYGLPAAEQEGLAKHDAAAPAPAEEEEGAVFGDYVFSTPSAPVLKEVVNSGGGRRGEGKGEGRGGRGEEEGEGRGGGVEGGGGGGGGGEGGRNQEEESSSSKREEAETNWRKGQKRKGVDAGESECLTEEAADCESGQASRRRRRSASSRRSRAAEVHNLAERRRRDRINEKMKALQELIPHCNKSDKASMLDEAIEYLKSLQLQLQMMWMGSGMAAMMVNPMMACMGVGPPPSQGGLQYPNFFPIGQPTAAYPGLNQAAVGRTFISPVNLQSSTSANLPEPYAHLLGPTQPPSQLSQREQRAAGVLAGGLWDPAPGVDHK